MKASEENLTKSLTTLNWFNQHSRLEIDSTKPKVIRIGRLWETNRRYSKENNLDWVSSLGDLGIQ